jgi:hypothetical protein
MKFDVLKNDKRLGTLTFHVGVYNFIGEDACKIFIANNVRAGLKIKKDVCVDGIFSIVEKPIENSDPLFAFALIDFLRDSGYTLYESIESVEQAFDKILHDLAGKPDVCVQLAARWAKMSTLEKTYLLDCLEKELVKNLYD